MDLRNTLDRRQAYFYQRYLEHLRYFILDARTFLWHFSAMIHVSKVLKSANEYFHLLVFDIQSQLENDKLISGLGKYLNMGSELHKDKLTERYMQARLFYSDLFSSYIRTLIYGSFFSEQKNCFLRVIKIVN